MGYPAKKLNDQEVLDGDEIESFGTTKEIVDEGFENLETYSDAHIERRELGAHVENQGFFGKTLEKLGFHRRETELMGETAEVLQDDAKIESALAKKEKLENMGSLQKKALYWAAGKKSTGNETLSHLNGTLEDLGDKYLSDERNEKGELKVRSFTEIMGEDAKANIFEKFWLRLSHPVEYFRYLLAKQIVKKHRKEIEKIRTAKDIVEKGDRLYDKAEDLAETGEHALHIAGEGKEQYNVLRTEKIERNRQLKKFAKKHRDEFAGVIQDLPKLGPEDFSKEVSKLCRETGGELAKYGDDASELLKKGKFPGMVMRGGTVMVTIETVKEAIAARGNWGELKATVTDTGWLSTTAEALPVWGSIRSYQRLDDHSVDIPQWARWGEFGMNAGLDAIFTVPTVVGFAFGGAPGAGLVAIRAALARAGSLGFRQVSKLVLRKAATEGGELVAEKGGTKLLEESGEVVAKQGGKKISKQALVQMAKKSPKKALTYMKKDAWKDLWPHLWRQGGTEVLLAGASWAWANHGPTKKEIATFTLEKTASPAQQKLGKVVLDQM